MHRQAWVALLLVVTLALAACGNEPEPAPPTTETPSDTAAAPANSPLAADNAATEEPAAGEIAATEEPAPDALDTDFNVVEPGLHARSGLTIVRSTEYAQGSAGAFFAEVRNDTDETLRAVDGSIDLLDGENVRLRAIPLYILLNDIPPGASFFIGDTFELPAGYADAAIWLDYTPTDSPTLDAFFDLPVTLEESGPGEAAPYSARGTVENTARRDLAFWALTLAALDADDNIIGLAHAVVTPPSENGWPAGTSASFEATFSALAGDASAVTTVVPSAAGYALREPGD